MQTGQERSIERCEGKRLRLSKRLRARTVVASTPSQSAVPDATKGYKLMEKRVEAILTKAVNMLAWIYSAWIVMNTLLVMAIEGCSVSAAGLTYVSYLSPLVFGLVLFLTLLWFGAPKKTKLIFGWCWILGGSFALFYTMLQDKASGCRLLL